jgi:predicted GNAT family N-acyltransferase
MTSQQRERVDSLVDKEFGHIPFVQNLTWSKPDWLVTLEEDNDLLALYHLVSREVQLDGQTYQAAGINNVITPQQHRKRGYASKLLQETNSFIFTELKSEFGLLLCADAVIPFYEKLGWYKVDCDLYFEQPDGIRLYDSNAMILSKEVRFSPKQINLNGLPW